jgi:hypothetical protein
MTTEEFVQHYKKHPVEFVELMYGKHLYWYQKIYLKALFRCKKIFMLKPFRCN